MPQLTPFFFINEIVFSFAIITISVYIFSKYILPRFTRLFVARVYTTSRFLSK